MKKKLLILILIIAISLVGILAGCDKQGNGGGGNGGGGNVDENKIVQDIDFMSAVNKSSNNNISVVVRSGSDVVYSYVNGKENKIVSELEISKATFSEATDAMNYSTSDFTDSKIEESASLGIATYSANIAAPNTFLGIEGEISNAKIVITINKDTKAFIKNVITYTIVEDGYEFDIEITIAAKD